MPHIFIAAPNGTVTQMVFESTFLKRGLHPVRVFWRAGGRASVQHIDDRGLYIGQKFVVDEHDLVPIE